MLILSRRKDESIVIDDDVEITVLDIKGSTVRLGIAAPKDVEVHRTEVYVQVKRDDYEQRCVADQ